MNIFTGIGDFFGLDIGTSSIRLVQLSSSGKGSPKNLVKYGHAPVDAKLVLSDARQDQQKVMQVIQKLITDSGITTPNVAVGLSSQRVFTTVVDMDRLSSDELAKSIQYQADSIIPTALAESKMDWVLLGDSPQDKTKVEVLVTSVANEFTETRLDLLESIGLNVIAFEPDSMALHRSLLAPDTTAPVLILDTGAKTTDLVISLQGSPRLIRSIPTGNETIVKAASQNLSITEDQAKQFVYKFGLVEEKLEGQVRGAIISTIDLLIEEIQKSIKFFQTRYAGTTLDKIIVAGGASSLPGFPLYVANKCKANVEIGNAWRNVTFAPERQNELLTISNFFTVAVGLAERDE